MSSYELKEVRARVFEAQDTLGLLRAIEQWYRALPQPRPTLLVIEFDVDEVTGEQATVHYEEV